MAGLLHWSFCGWMGCEETGPAGESRTLCALSPVSSSLSGFFQPSLLPGHHELSRGILPCVYTIMFQSWSKRTVTVTFEILSKINLSSFQHFLPRIFLAMERWSTKSPCWVISILQDSGSWEESSTITWTYFRRITWEHSEKINWHEREEAARPSGPCLPSTKCGLSMQWNIPRNGTDELGIRGTTHMNLKTLHSGCSQSQYHSHCVIWVMWDVQERQTCKGREAGFA